MANLYQVYLFVLDRIIPTARYIKESAHFTNAVCRVSAPLWQMYALARTSHKLIDNSIQKAFRENEKKQTITVEKSENTFRGKVICSCYSGKLQRRYGQNCEWAFFSCITNNRLGIEKCTGMYIRENDILNRVFAELNSFADEFCISEAEYKVHKQEYSNKFYAIVQKIYEEMSSSISYYEELVRCDINETEFTTLMSVGRALTLERDKLLASEKEYDEKYKVYQKLFKANRKGIPLSEIMDYIQTITIYQNKEIVINWNEIF